MDDFAVCKLMDVPRSELEQSNEPEFEEDED